MKWLCQAYRGMDTYRAPIEVEANTSEKAAQKAMMLVPFGDVMQCDPIGDWQSLGTDDADTPSREPER